MVVRWLSQIENFTPDGYAAVIRRGFIDRCWGFCITLYSLPLSLFLLSQTWNTRENIAGQNRARTFRDLLLIFPSFWILRSQTVFSLSLRRYRRKWNKSQSRERHFLAAVVTREIFIQGFSMLARLCAEIFLVLISLQMHILSSYSLYPYRKLISFKKIRRSRHRDIINSWIINDEKLEKILINYFLKNREKLISR